MHRADRGKSFGSINMALQMNIKALFLVSLSCLVGCSSIAPQVRPNILTDALKNYEVVDLTHTLDKDFPFIPVPGITFPFALEPIANILTHGVAANAWKIHEHMGTQIDAPNHFAAGGKSLEAITAQEQIAPIVVIDFRRESEADRDARLSVEHIKAWEALHGQITDGSVVALYTGWDAKIGDASYIGLDEQKVKHFPGFGVDAIDFLVKQRNIWGVAVDTLSFDPGNDHEYRSHKALLGAGKWALEAVANLKRVPPTGATVFIGAPKVRDATGGLVRVIAMVPKVSSDALPLQGRWRSVNVEQIRAASGRLTYLTRMFTFEKDKWTVEFTIFADVAGRAPLLRGVNQGVFKAGDRLHLIDATAMDFSFVSRTLTPLVEDMASTLTSANCGSKPWRVNESQDVIREGCAIARVPSLQNCSGEFDVVRISAGKLFLGARPATLDMCSSSRRPMFPGEDALTRIQ
jgi:kynurenine formamidase